MTIPNKYETHLRLMKYAAGPVLVLLAPGSAQATTITGFTGYFDPTNWTLTNSSGGDGFVDSSGAPASIDLHGANNGASGNQADFTIALNAAGSWSFNWVWDNQDISLGYDFTGYLLNGVFFGLAGADASGSVGPIAVNIGDVIGYRAECSDCVLGPGVLTVSNFSAPAASEVPEPASLLLMSLGAAGLVAARRRRKAN